MNIHSLPIHRYDKLAASRRTYELIRPLHVLPLLSFLFFLARSTTTASLQELALAALRAALLKGEGLDSLAPLPTPTAHHLFKILALMLHQGSDTSVAPPINLVRLFYGGKLEKLRQVGAVDDWAGEVFGGGLSGLRSLTLLHPRLTAHGYGHVVCALGECLEELTITESSQPLSEACVVLLCVGCCVLKRLRLTSCKLALSPDAAATLLSNLPALLELDLSDNPLERSAAHVLCEHASAACPSLSALSLSGSFADDEVCMAAMMLPISLDRLDLSWSRISGEGASFVVAGLGERLRECRLGNLGNLQAGDASRFLPALARVACLHLGGVSLDDDDCAAIARLPASLTALNLRDARLVGAGRLRAFELLLTLTNVAELCLAGMSGGGGSDGDGQADAPLGDSVEHSWLASLTASLTHLDCADCSFEQACATSLAACIRRSRHRLQRAELRRAPHVVAQLVLDPVLPNDDDFVSFPCLTLLDVTGALTRASVAPLINLAAAQCPVLHTLHADNNAWITDGCVGGLPRGGLRRSLRVLTLKASSCSAHSLPTFRALPDLEVLDLDGSSVSAAQAATLPTMQRKAAATMAADALAEKMRRRQEGGGHAEMGERGGARARGESCGEDALTVIRYSAEKLRALRDSPYSQLPTRPLPSLPGVVLPPID